MKLKNIHSEFMNNLEGDSITANQRDNLPVLYKYGAMLFCWDIRLQRVIAVFILLVFNFSLAKLHHCGPSSLKVVKKILDAGEISSDIISMTDEMYHQQQKYGTPKGVYLPISKIHSILAVANLLAHSNLWYIIIASTSKFGTTEIEFCFEMGK